MTNKLPQEIIFKIRAAARAHFPYKDVMLAAVHPQLAESTSPTDEQCLAIGYIEGLLRTYVDDDGDNGWFRSTSAKHFGELVKCCCEHGMTVSQAMSILSSAVDIGVDEYT